MKVIDFFKFKCDTCLCWQHGDCINIKKGEKVPSNYSCWVCSEPENKLKSLKYKNWSNTRLEKEILNRLESLEADDEDKNEEEYNKLCLLNDFSRRYYNLNLLMYTLEYQMSLFNRMIKNLNKINKTNRVVNDLDQSDSNNIETSIDYDDQTFGLIDKLSLNVDHLQTCIVKKFEQFNSKLDGKTFISYLNLNKIFLNNY